MVQAARRRVTFEEYLRIEELSPAVKHELIDGQVIAMAGGTLEHAAIAMNVGVLLTAQLRGRRCRVMSSDLRIRIKATGISTYPDISVVCGAVEMDPDDPKDTTLLNPKLIVEVLSPSTEDYDRGEKLAHYKQIPSLEAVLLIAHDEQRVELWRRTDGRWTLDVARERETLHVAALGCSLPLDEVFRDPLAED